MAIVTKTCNACETAKPLEAYPPHLDRCRDCHNRIRRERRAADAPIIPCVWCGQDFKRLKGSQKICSAVCKKAWDRQRAGLAPSITERACDECGTQFHPRTKISRHCSSLCRGREKHRIKSGDPEYLQRRKEYQKRFAVENAERERMRARLRRERDGDRIRKTNREWAAAHKYQFRPSWRVKYPEKAAAKQRLRTARVKELTPFPIRHEDVMAKLAYWGNVCWMCKAPYEAVDHVKPIAKQGLNIIANMRPICRSCNSRKRDRWFGVKGLSLLHKFD